MGAVDTETLVDTWQRLLSASGSPWVLFEHGTCVLVHGPQAELAERAVALLREFGPVRTASPAAAFAVIDVRDADGWVVTGHHQDVLTYVSPEEAGAGGNVAVGMCGRAKRHLDGTELHVVHVEDHPAPVRDVC